jgi:hypothetical protein
MRVCLILFNIYLVGLFIYCTIAFVSPSTLGFRAFSLEEFFAFMALGAISVAWWGVPIFLLVASVTWVAVRIVETRKRRPKP